MKIFILIFGIAVLTAAGANAQGTINSGGGRVQFRDLLGGTLPVAFPFNVAVYFAETPGAWQGPVLPLGRSISDSGFFSGPAVLLIPGTEAGQVVSMQIYAWNAQFGDDPYQAWLTGAGTAATDVRQVELSPAAGPGTIIWQGEEGTNPNRFTPLTFWNNGFRGPPPPVVPEPSTLALGVVGALMLLLRWRKSALK